MSADYRQALIEAEAREREHGYTLGSFNEVDHACAEGNPQLLRIESGHLEYVQGKGIRKTQERDCLRCHDTGLNDGRFHQLPLSPLV